MASPPKGDFRINTCSSKTSRQLVPAGFCYGNSRLLQQPTFQRWLAPPTLLVSSTDLTSQEHRVWFGSLTRSPCALTHKYIYTHTGRHSTHTHTLIYVAHSPPLSRTVLLPTHLISRSVLDKTVFFCSDPPRCDLRTVLPHPVPPA